MDHGPVLDENFLNGAAALDFAALRHEIVLGPPHAAAYGRNDAFADHLQMLRGEFSGQSGLKFAHAALIAAIRRGINTDENMRRFTAMWHDQANFLLEVLDTRWLVSACETIADHSPDRNEARIAILASLFANTLKLYETERAVTPMGEPGQVQRRIPIFDGLTAYVIGHGDMIANLLRRIDATFDGSTIADCIAREIIHRAQRVDTVFERFNRKQVVHQWATARAVVRFPPAPRKNAYLPPAAGSGPGYILLNDTGRLGQGFHAGTTFACAAIRQGLAARGLHEIGWANDELTFDQLLHDSAPRLIVLNGEGTMHHGAARAAELLRCCEKAKERGVPVVLMNSVWQDNPPSFAQSLRAFDRIYVRDRASLAELPEGLGARHLADVSIAGFAPFYAQGRFDDAPHDLAVIDSVLPQVSHELQDFAQRQEAAFYAMPYGSLAALRTRAAQDGTAFPRLLQAPDLMSARGWLTGRFHGLVAALCAGRPVCAIPSNTFKIEAMLGDAQLLHECLLPSDWTQADGATRRRMVDARLAAQADPGFIERRALFIAQAGRGIASMFDDLASLVMQRAN
ncbi:polysaccharide pyruvyl transferase family protein [Paracoccus laeviglucosivorans]|uniref:Polysaccharide pyruvyl transferase n=1 Tax=Paracoccus laeviglucosivorans TaxID=1197861 RepID=A0A521EHW0_9RHOB|nr:polysaccharide pyruvyl transferase family protein [Paracoccus laeviglucosivorans]SMO83506.1 hypothetical protein SAMN06265221_11377 [Paracoccus laeviglucosivorans]